MLLHWMKSGLAKKYSLNCVKYAAFLQKYEKVVKERFGNEPAEIFENNINLDIQEFCAKHKNGLGFYNGFSNQSISIFL